MFLKGGRKSILLLAMLVAFFSYTPDAWAQEVDEDVNAEETSGSGGGPGGDPDVPLDGGLSVLLAMGAALGGKTVYVRYKGKKSNNKQ